MMKLPTSLGAADCSPRPIRRSLFSMLVLGVILSGCTSATEPTDELFEQHEVVLGSAERQTVLTGFLFGGAMADLAVVNIEENDDRRLRIYSFGDSTWRPKVDAVLRPDVLFVDVANIGGRDRLITGEHERLNWFDPESATEHVLVKIATSYKATHEGEIPHVDITRDVTHDGRDDLVVPNLDGFWISTQSSDGSFADPVKLGPPEPFLAEIPLEHKHIYGEVGLNARTIPWYLSRIHELDYNLDERSDLVFWNDDHFDVYYQDARGQFSSVAETFTVDVPFDSDGIYSLMFGFRDESTLRLLFGFRKSTGRTVLHSFRDMNGDGVADLLTLSLEGRSLLRQRSRYEVHFGTSTPNGIRFARDVSTAIHPRRPAPIGYSLEWFQDLDGDGQIDMMLGTVNTGIGKMFRALAANSITMNLEFYRIEDAVYPDTPNGSRYVKPNLTPLSGRGPFFPTVLLGDVDGDGRPDLLVGENWEELKVHLGVPGRDVFAPQPQRVAVAMTANERDARLLDLNEDGKKDLLIHHPSSTEPHRVILLIAR